MASHSSGTGASRGSEMLRKTWVKAAIGIVVLILIVVFIVPLFVNADTFRPTIEQKISAALGRPVTLGHLSFSLLSGSLVADNVTIADDPAFSSAPFFQAKSLHIGVSTGALLFERQLHITNFTADSPQIQLISKPDGSWNYASLGAGKSSSASQSGSPTDVSIGKFQIKNGSVNISSIPATGQPFVYNHVDVTVKNLSFTTPMPFELTADLPANGTVKLTGTAGPIAQPNAMNTPLQANVEVKHFDPVASGAIAPADGISMIADFNAKIDSNGKTLTTTGKLTATNLKLSPSGSPAPQPVDADLTMTGNLAARNGELNDLAIHTGNLAAHVNGAYQMTGDTVSLNLKLSAPGLPVDGLEQLLPAVGVKLPNGSKLQGGTLTANLAISGTPATLRIAGPVEIDNTRLAGFALAQKIGGLASAAGSSSGNATDIRKLSANVVETPQSTDLSQIDCEVPTLGTATGNGTVAASGALNFQLTAKLNATGGVGGAVTTAMSNMGGMVGNFFHTAATNGVPISVTGTTSDPKIQANLSAMLKQQTTGSSKTSTTKSGILGSAGSFFHK